ncbi:hypothetical protein F4802DRAFT_305040 [Xylaria palmicola]|nr:hypothetical protein F4802DRAFT_305040 [Xylaria palmicola]
MMYNTKALLALATLTGASVAQQTTGGGGDAGGSSDASCTASYASLLAGAPTPSGELASAITSYASGAVQTATESGGGSGGGGGGANPLAIATQVCSFSSQLPESLQSEFDAYVTSVRSYVSASTSAIDAVITDCVATGAEGDAYTSLVNSFATETGPLCGAAATTTGGNNGTATATTTGTGGAGGVGTGTSGATTTTAAGTTEGGGGATTSIPTAAAAVPTAVFGGVVAAAGFLGAVALL